MQYLSKTHALDAVDDHHLSLSIPDGDPLATSTARDPATNKLSSHQRHHQTPSTIQSRSP